MKKLFLSILLLFTFNVFSQNEDTIKTQQLKEIEISAYKATDASPITFKNLDKNDISIKNYGQEPTQILNYTPSVTSYSDNGSYQGYTYYRLRGIDQTRINMTLNGVPMNEPENQQCYFSNYPDILQSLQNVQLQRGSGMSKNGASSYAGSLDFESYIPSNQNIIVYYGMGSYNSSRLSWQIEDLLFKKVRFYIQASSISTDGYKYHSGNKSNSVFFVSDYSYKKNRFKLVAFIGSSTNKLAWIGAPMDSIKKDNRYNSCTTGENDDFIQNHIQFHHTYLFDSKNKINYCVYYNYIKGGYTFDYPNFLNQNNDNSVEKSNTYINKYDVVENFTGFYVNYSKNTEYLTWLIGFNSYDYNCKHIGSAQQLNQLSNLWGPDNTSNYTNIGFRDEKSLYTKIILKLDNLHVYGDIQYRHSTFTYQGQDITKYYRWNFLNHSYGVDFSKNNYKIYYNIGKSYREPCRNDLFNGYDNPTISDIVDLKPESVIDQELGYKYNSKKLYLNFNLYFMNFKDELTLTGQTGPGGYPLHENVDKSYRKGIELDMKYKFNNGLFLSNSSCLNRSVIEQKGIDIVQVLTPSTIVNQEIGVDKKYFTIGLIFRYQSFSYIDFENTKDYELPEYKTINLRFGIKYKSVEWSLYLNNITSEKYFNMGNVGGNRPVYFANAPINFFTGVKIRLR